MRILVVRFSALGDVVLTSGVLSWLYKNLNTCYQGCEPSQADSIFNGRPPVVYAVDMIAPNIATSTELSVNADELLNSISAEPVEIGDNVDKVERQVASGSYDRSRSNTSVPDNGRQEMSGINDSGRSNASAPDSGRQVASGSYDRSRSNTSVPDNGRQEMSGSYDGSRSNASVPDNGRQEMLDLDTGIGAVQSVPDAKLCTGVTIDILTFGEYEEVWSDVPFVHRVFTVPRGIALVDYTHILKSMPEYNYILDLHGNARSFIARKVFKGKSYKYDKNSIARRIYVKFRLMGDKLTSHVVQKYAEAALPIINNIAKLTGTSQVELPSLEELRPTLGKNICNPQKGMIIMHPFASKATKVWGGAAELAKELVSKGYSVKVVGEGEFPQISGVDRVNTPSIKELIACIGQAELFITTDSGPMHVAIALGRKVLAIFGSTSRELGFYPSFENCFVIEREIDCRPCDVHGLSKCPKRHFKCMLDIKVDEVLERVDEILEDR